MELLSLEGQWTPQVINCVVNIRCEEMGPSLSQAAGLNFNEAEKNHV